MTWVIWCLIVALAIVVGFGIGMFAVVDSWIPGKKQK